jgi:GNAT superfamily N-acetyltransferase
VTATARIATSSDLSLVESLYRELEAEMEPLSDLWHIVDGLPEPVGESIGSAIADPASTVVVGEYDGFPFGFMIATIIGTLPQGDGLRLGSIRFVYVDQAVRAVGVGEAMRDLMLDTLRADGVRRFDAHVLPGHRLAKNFFEQGGFSARHIVMHHDDADDD